MLTHLCVRWDDNRFNRYIPHGLESASALWYCNILLWENNPNWTFAKINKEIFCFEFRERGNYMLIKIDRWTLEIFHRQLNKGKKYPLIIFYLFPFGLLTLEHVIPREIVLRLCFILTSICSDSPTCCPHCYQIVVGTERILKLCSHCVSKQKNKHFQYLGRSEKVYIFCSHIQGNTRNL